MSICDVLFVLLSGVCYRIYAALWSVTCRIKSLDRKRSHSSFYRNLKGTVHFFRSKLKSDFILLMLQLSRPRIVL